MIPNVTFEVRLEFYRIVWCEAQLFTRSRPFYNMLQVIPPEQIYFSEHPIFGGIENNKGREARNLPLFLNQQ